MNKAEVAYLSWSVLLRKIHLQVPVNELTLAQTNHLHTEHRGQNGGDKVFFDILTLKLSVFLSLSLQLPILQYMWSCGRCLRCNSLEYAVLCVTCALLY